MLPKPAPLLHCDWLQCSIKWVHQSIGYFSPFYRYKRLEFSTRHFKVVEELFVNDKRIATITRCPCSPILDPLMAIVKFDNWVLYDDAKHEIILGFFQRNGIDFICLSRVDFCCDFNVFDNGMIPDKFIKKYVARKFLRKGKTSQVAHNFGQGKNEHYEKGLKFGSNLSEVTAYMYDKSREMKEAHWKPYIYMTWIKGGLDIARPVWRVEISVKSGGLLMVNTVDGLIDIFLTLQVVHDDYIYKCFCILVERYFTFVWNDGQQKLSRMRVLKLFNFAKQSEVLVKAEQTEDADRSKKIFVKKLNQLNNELRGIDFDMNIQMQAFQRKIIEDSHLQSWAMKNNLNI
jgi:hypothetical protein